MAPPLPPRELVYLPLAELSPDETFRLRPAGDISSLAQSIAQVGQLQPIVVRLEKGSYQPITGFRRLAALRMLHRQRVLARVHPTLDDAKAALLAAADALDSRPLEIEELEEMQARYRERGWSTPALDELIARALDEAKQSMEDLEARLLGHEPPDRSIVDEDAIPDAEADGTLAEVQQGKSTPPADLAEGGAKSRQTPADPVGAGERTISSDPHGPLSPTAVQAPSDPPGAQPLSPSGETTSTAVLGEAVARQLASASQGLGELLQRWAEVPEPLRRIIAEQIAYYQDAKRWIDEDPGEDA